MTRETLLERARAMVPTLRARAEHCERIRQLPLETHRDFVAAGFYRIHQPKRFGGYELDWALLLELGAEIGRGCASSAWVFAQLAGHVYIQGMRHIEAQEELWGGNPDATVSSAFPIEGKTARVDGGFVLDGAWNFASGCDVAEWNDFMCFVPRAGGGPPEHLFCLVPRREWTIVDDWFPTGLAGTGSKRLAVENVFVPAHRALLSENCRGGPTEGSQFNPYYVYKLPIMAAGGPLFSGTALGAALCALDFIEEEFKMRSSVAGVKLAEQQSVQLRLAEAGARIDAAWALLRQDCAEATDHAGRGEQPPLETRVRWRRNTAFGMRLCNEAVETLYPLAGGRGLAFNSPFQRAWRDCRAAASQIIVNWDLMATHWGRAKFGLPVSDPRI